MKFLSTYLCSFLWLTSVAAWDNQTTTGTCSPAVRDDTSNFYITCQGLSESAEKTLIARYTGRFAAKEAFMKAIAISNTKVGFHEIEIFNHENGAPYIVTSKRATDILAQLMVNQIHISISHDADVAVAVVILER
jgi:holo-[acyl-carrier protein] synthase